MTLSADDPRWFPVASSDDLPFRHVFHGQLLGRELAIWRADDGHINVWENRCLHRGVRLSIGLNEGAELKCQYHGWRYANRSAGCTYIPAHPADAPARRVQNRTYPARERGGLVWASLAPDTPFPDIPLGEPSKAAGLVLRPIPVMAAPEAVAEGLAAAVSGKRDGLGVTTAEAFYVVQPVDAGRSVMRGVLLSRPVEEDAALRAHNRALVRLRDRLEARARRQPPPAPLTPRIEPVSVDLSTMPDIAIPAGTTLTVMIKRKWATAEGVTALELVDREGRHLPTFQPGAHIDLHLPNGLVRQYSITNGPGELLSYTIAVKREPDSSGGSAAISETLREGDLLAISEPRNNFPLRRDATRTVLLAGGIGITPLLAMARFLAASNLPFALHCFVRDAGALALPERIAALGDAVTVHEGLTPQATSETIAEALGPWSRANHVYICGPGPMLETARALAAEQGWPEEAVHFEYFKNDTVRDQSSSFEIELARSALTLEVPAGKSVLDVVREAGVSAISSCEQGACGTCLTTVLEGEVDHQDVYLNASEKRSNTTMMTCVSRARSARLVLDL